MTNYKELLAQNRGTEKQTVRAFEKLLEKTRGKLDRAMRPVTKLQGEEDSYLTSIRSVQDKHHAEMVRINREWKAADPEGYEKEMDASVERARKVLDGFS